MAKESMALICENKKIAPDTYRMRLKSDLCEEIHCGQFVQVLVPGYFLRRPISVCEVCGDEIILVYRIVGDGTKEMARMKEGMRLSLLGPLGNGFPEEGGDVLLIGGGLGTPPLIEAAKTVIRHKGKATAVLGFNDKASEILVGRFREIGCEVYIATMDGSDGTRGTVMDAIRENGLNAQTVYACGPAMMLKAVSETFDNGFVSLESRMGCGFGTCMGCVVKDKEGHSMRVCHEGPVFPIGKVVIE